MLNNFCWRPAASSKNIHVFTCRLFLKGLCWPVSFNLNIHQSELRLSIIIFTYLAKQRIRFFSLWALSKSYLLAQQVSRGFMRKVCLCNKGGSFIEENVISSSVEPGIQLKGVLKIKASGEQFWESGGNEWVWNKKISLNRETRVSETMG